MYSCDPVAVFQIVQASETSKETADAISKVMASIKPRVAGRQGHGLVDVGPSRPRQSSAASSSRAVRASTAVDAADAALASDSSVSALASSVPLRPAKAPRLAPRLGGRLARVGAEAASASLDSDDSPVANARSPGLSQLPPAALLRSQPVTCSLQRILSGQRGPGHDAYAAATSHVSASELPMPKLQDLDVLSVSSPHVTAGSLQSTAIASSTASSEASPVLHDADDTANCAEPDRLLVSSPGSSNSASRLRTELEPLTRDVLRLRCLEEGLDVDSKLSRAGYISAMVAAATNGSLASAIESPDVHSVRRLLARLSKNHLMRCAALILGHDGWHEGQPTSKFYAISSIMASMTAGVTTESMARVAVEMARAGARSDVAQPVKKSTAADSSSADQHCNIIDARTRLLLELRCMTKESLLLRASAHGFTAAATVGLETVVKAVFEAEGSPQSGGVSAAQRIDLTSRDEARRRSAVQMTKPAAASVGKAAAEPKTMHRGPSHRAASSRGAVDLSLGSSGVNRCDVPPVEAKVANDDDCRGRDDDASVPLQSATPLDTADLLCRALVWTYDCAAPESSARRAATVTYQGAFVRNVTSGLNDYHGIGVYACAATPHVERPTLTGPASTAHAPNVVKMPFMLAGFVPLVCFMTSRAVSRHEEALSACIEPALGCSAGLVYPLSRLFLLSPTVEYGHDWVKTFCG